MTATAWRAVGLAVPGSAHVAQGRDGDDAFAAAPVATADAAGGAIALALADGVGSRPFSGAAARLAAHAAVAELRHGDPLPEDPDRLVVRCGEALIAAQQAVDLTAAVIAAVEPPACTLLLAVATVDVLVCLTVGDGAVVHLTDDGAVLMPVGPDPDESGSASVVTALVAGAPCPSPQVRVIVEAAVKAVALTSDGLANISVVRTPEGPVIAQASALDVLVRHVAEGGGPRTVRDYFTTDGPLRERTSDDLSLVVATR